MKFPTRTIFSIPANNDSSAGHTVVPSGSSSSSWLPTVELPSAEERIHKIFAYITRRLDDISYSPKDEEQLHKLVDKEVH